MPLDFGRAERGTCDACDKTRPDVRTYAAGADSLRLCGACLVGLAEGTGETVQDVDEAHHALTMAGIGDGELSERVDDLIEERDRLDREREELADLLGDMAHTDCNCGDCFCCKARRYVVHKCHDGDCMNDREHDCHSSTCKDQQPFVLASAAAGINEGSK